MPIGKNRAYSVSRRLCSQQIVFKPASVFISIDAIEPCPYPYLASLVLCDRSNLSRDGHRRRRTGDQPSVMHAEESLSPCSKPQVSPTVRKNICCVGRRESFRLAKWSERSLTPAAHPSCQHPNPQISFFIHQERSYIVIR